MIAFIAVATAGVNVCAPRPAARRRRGQQAPKPLRSRRYDPEFGGLAGGRQRAGRLRAAAQAAHAAAEASTSALREQLNTAVAQLNTLREQTGAEIPKLRQQLGAGPSAGGAGASAKSPIDIKGLGKPGMFDSTDARKFPHWKFKFKNFVCGVFEEAELALDWARAQEAAITADSITRELSAMSDAMSMSKQVYTALAALTDGEALSIVMNDPARNGLECWRRLNRRFDPQAAGRHKNAMSAILAVKSVSLKELPAAIERWEQKVRHYEDSSKKAVSDDVKTAALTEMCPLSLIHI